MSNDSQLVPEFQPMTGNNMYSDPVLLSEISKVLGASLLTKRDIKELLNVPEPLTQNQNVNELKLDF